MGILPEIFSKCIRENGVIIDFAKDDAVIEEPIVKSQQARSRAQWTPAQRAFLEMVLKEFNPDQPRGDDGKWIRYKVILAAAGNPAAEDELRAKVTDPIQLEKLENMLKVAYQAKAHNPNSPLLPGMEDPRGGSLAGMDPKEVLGILSKQYESAKQDLDDIADSIDGNMVTIKAMPTLDEMNDIPDDFLSGKVDEFFENLDDEVEQARNDEADAVLDDPSEPAEEYAKEVYDLLGMSDELREAVHDKFDFSRVGLSDDLYQDLVDVMSDKSEFDESLHAELDEVLGTDEEPKDLPDMPESFEERMDSLREHAYDYFDVDGKLQELREDKMDEAYEYASEAWQMLSPEDKMAEIGMDPEMDIVLDVDEARPYGKKIDEGAHANSRAVADEMVRIRTERLFAKNNVQVDPEQAKETVYGMFEEWIDSSSTLGARELMQVIHTEFGGLLRDGFEVPSMQEVASRHANSYGKSDPDDVADMEKAIRLTARAKWEVSQWLLQKAEMDNVLLYRGIRLDVDKSDPVREFYEKDGSQPDSQVMSVYTNANTPAYRSSVANRVSEHVRLPEVELMKSTLQSTTTELDVANSFGGVKIRMDIPREMVFAVPAYGDNRHKEEEYIVMGGHWPKWDLWQGSSVPTPDKVPFKEAA